MPARPDFGMLRASMIAAQAITPTALASTLASQARSDPRDALASLFGPLGAEAPDGLGGSFSVQPKLARDVEER